MKILILMDRGTGGGAAIAAQRLCRALEGRGHTACWLTASARALEEPVVYDFRKFGFGSRVILRLARAFARGDATSLRRRMRVARIRKIIQQVRPDVVSVQNLHGSHLPATLPAELSRYWPVVWTLHDMWAFTGGCAYDLGCGAFKTGCRRACPTADQYPFPAADRVGKMFREREAALSWAGRLAFVTPSSWLAQEVRRGMLRAQHVQVIPYSLDLDVFQPIDRGEARRRLELPTNTPVVMSASPSLRNPRKGTRYLVQALAKI